MLSRDAGQADWILVSGMFINAVLGDQGHRLVRQEAAFSPAISNRAPSCRIDWEHARCFRLTASRLHPVDNPCKEHGYTFLHGSGSALLGLA